LECEGLLKIIKKNKDIKDIPQDYLFESFSNLSPFSSTNFYFEFGIPIHSCSKIYLCDFNLDTIDIVFNDELPAGLYRINLNTQNYNFHRSGLYFLIVNAEQSGDIDFNTGKLKKRFEGYGKFIVIK